MADGPSAEDAAADLGDSDSRLTRERHKRPDGLCSTTSLATGPDATRRVHDDASVLENHRQPQHQHRPLRRNCHGHPHPSRRHPGNGNVAGEYPANNNNHHYHYYRREHEEVDGADDDDGSSERVSKNESASVDATCVAPFTSSTLGDGDEDEDEDTDDDDDDDDDGDEAEEEEEEDAGTGGSEQQQQQQQQKKKKKKKKKIVGKRCRIGGGVRVDGTKTVKREGSDSDNGNSKVNVNDGGQGGSSSIGDARCSRSADRPVEVSVRRLSRENDEDGDEDESENENGHGHEQQRRDRALEKTNRLGCDKNNEAGRGDEDAARKTESDGIVRSDGGNGSSGGSGGSGSGGAAAAAVSASGAAGVTANGLVAARHQGSPFKGQVRTAEDTLVGPCGKKRCADRYDSSESSDSGVAVSCGECSSSGTSDITEPGSPCSTSSDEGVAIRGASASPLPSLPKLAPSSQISTRPQWPWTPPLAATACSTYKRLKGEPEAGALPRSGAADPSVRGATKSAGKPSAVGHHRHESQGKITEYFKTQIKPQQPKIKKNGESMSVLVAKSSTEFRRPATVQRNCKAGLAKYLGTVSPPNGRAATTGAASAPAKASDWEVRSLTISSSSSSSSPPAPTKKPPPPPPQSPVIVARTNGKMEKKLAKPVPSLAISNDVLKNITSCKISSLRSTSEASPNAKTGSPASTPSAASLGGEATGLDFTGCILAKPHVNENNNNLTNGCAPGILASLRSQASQDPLSRLAVPKEPGSSEETRPSPADEEDAEEEEEDSRSSESKAPLSPILSAPTTIRFPAREPEKDRQQATDSGVCRWDKCEESFESSGELLEHLQVAHINTQTGGDNFVCQWQGCKVQGRSSCSRRWLERHVLSHGGNKPFRCIVDNCGSRFSSQTALERHVNGHFNQPETSNANAKRSCESGGKLVRRNGKRLRYRRQPWSARLFDYFDSGVMEGLQHRLLKLAKCRTQGRLAETPGNSMALTSQVLARRVELDGKAKVLLRWYPPDIEPDEWVLESEVQSTKNVGIRKVASSHPEEVSLALYSALGGGATAAAAFARAKQRRKPAKNS